jgi:signal transduction histidine kinase
VTEHKLAAETLERTVAERTRQLRDTIAELEAFSYSISHDMRSPLRAMQGFARAILLDHEQSLPADVVDLLGRIQRGAARLDLLVRDVLAYSKVSRGEARLSAVELGSLIEDLLAQLPELQDAKHYVTIEHPLLNVVGHEGYLSQCFTNLIENALKFIEPGQAPEIRIRTEPVGMGSVRVCVQDQGIGIAPEHHERIFQIFGRIHPEKKYPGTGIGLAIVKRAIERMHGEVGFDSELGKGSRFWFILRSV